MEYLRVHTKIFKDFEETAVHSCTLSIFLTWNLPWPASGVPSPLHDCSAGGVVDKPKSGLPPQTKKSHSGLIKRQWESLQGRWLAKWLQPYRKAMMGQSSDLLLFAAYHFIHDISRRYSVRMMEPVQQQPGVWWSNDTHQVWCGKSNC